MQEVRFALRALHYSPSTEQAYAGWIRRFIVFHGKRHPSEMGSQEVRAFLTALAVKNQVSASTQNQAFSALLFLYRVILKKPLSGLEDTPRAKRPSLLPVVLSRAEVAAVLTVLEGTPLVMATLLYGGGLRVDECMRLRVKDLDFDRGELTVRNGKDEMKRLATVVVA